MLKKGVFYCFLSCFLQTEFLTEPETFGFNYDSWVPGPRNPPASVLSQSWGHRHLPLCLTFYVGAKAQTQILILIQLALMTQPSPQPAHCTFFPKNLVSHTFLRLFLCEICFLKFFCSGLRQLFQLARPLGCLSLAFASCLLNYASPSAPCPQCGSLSWKGSLLRLFFKFHQSSSSVNTHLIRSLLLSPAFAETSLLLQLLSLTRPAGSPSKHLGLFWSSLEVSLIPDADAANISGS